MKWVGPVIFSFGVKIMKKQGYSREACSKYCLLDVNT